LIIVKQHLDDEIEQFELKQNEEDEVKLELQPIEEE